MIPKKTKFQEGGQNFALLSLWNFITFYAWSLFSCCIFSVPKEQFLHFSHVEQVVHL